MADENTARDRSEEVDPIDALINEEKYEIDTAAKKAEKEIIPEELSGISQHLKETTSKIDAALRLPYSKNVETPEGMFIKSGNEEGKVSVVGEKTNIAAFTHTGVNKKRNDDGFLVHGESNTLAVTDGVGGNKHGEVASNVILHKMAQKLKDQDVPLKDIPNLVFKAVRDYQKSNGEEYEKCSATFAAVHITPEGMAQMVHVGDARIYRIRNGEAKQLTTDDSLTELVKAQKDMTDVEAKDYINDNYPNPRPDALVQSIGGREQVVNFKNKKGDIETAKDIVNPHFYEEQTQEGDVYVVSTDGFSGNMDAEDTEKYITKGLKAGKALNVVLEEMREEAIAKMIDGVGDKDNLTAGVIEIK